MRVVAGVHWCILILLWAQGVAATGPTAISQDYTWPLPLDRALSSTFGETRPPGDVPPTAFHAGIDLKTWGKTGYEVRALADGHVMRVRTSPWGYGRAIYQRLDDGRIALYAHLQAFAEPTATRVEQAQQQTQRYTTDLWLEKDDIILTKGQVIAWTGKTGAGPAHLHLELRDKDNVPINPLSHGFQVRDTTPPTIRSVAFVPLGPRSTVDGTPQPVIIDLRWDADRKAYYGGSTPIVFGRVGVAVLGHDRADLAQNRLAPFRNDLVIDGEMILSATYQRVAYQDAFQASMDRLRLGAKGTFASLFRLRGNRLEFYTSSRTTPANGVLFCGVTPPAALTHSATKLSKGTHDLEINSLDVAGNSCTARLRFIVDAPPRIVSSRLVRGSKGSRFLEAELIDPDDDLLKVEVAQSVAGSDWETISASRLAASSGPFTWPLPEASQMVRLRVEDSTGARAFRTYATGEPVARPSSISQSGSKPESRPTSHLVIEQTHFPNFVELQMTADQVLAAPPALLWHPFTAASGMLWQTDLTEYRAVIHFDSVAPQSSSADPDAGAAAVEELSIAVEANIAATGARLLQTIVLNARPVHEAAAAVLSFHDGATRLSFPRGSVYETIFPQALLVTLQNSVGEAAVPATQAAYRFGPAGVTFNQKVSIALRVPDEIEDSEKMAVYVDHSGKGKWAFAGQEVELVNGRCYVTTRVRSFGHQYALRGDRQPPKITEVQPADGVKVSGDRGLELSASIEDEDSGIGREEDIVMSLNGRRLISVYDPDASRVDYSADDRQPPGSYELVVTVIDRCGNEASGTSKFTVD
jgi:hypothetical protein